MSNSESISRRRFAVGTLGFGVTAASIFGVFTVNAEKDDAEAAVETVKTYYNSDDTHDLESINRINRDHLPGDTIVVVVETSAGTEERVFVEDRNGWEVVRVDTGF